MKESFLLYYEYEEYFNELSDSEGMMLLKAIFAYEKRGEILPLDGMGKAFFMVITNALERNKEKYAKISQVRSAAGSKGAEIKQTKQIEANQANANTCQQTEANQAVPDPDPVPENDPEPVREEKNEALFSVTQFRVTQNNLSSDIEEDRKCWNESGAKPIERRTVLQFNPDEMKSCSITAQHFKPPQVKDALMNYLGLLKSLDHEVSSPYRSFTGFMRTGVAKFVTEADPWNEYRKKALGSASGKKDLFVWKPEEESISAEN
jgi:hypothetical protein